MLIRILISLGALLVLALLALTGYRVWFGLRSGERFAELGLAEEQSGPERFSLELLEGLPEPARRYLSQAIAPGTGLWRRVEFSGFGRIELNGKWQDFEFSERLAAEKGFVWRAHLKDMPVYTDDYYFERAGGVNVFLLQIIPLVRSSGSDVARSASHRFAVEHVWLPTALLPGRKVRWEAVDESRARVFIRTDLDEEVPITLTVDEEGRLQSLSMERWSQASDEGPWTLRGYEAQILEQASFDGVSIPTRIRIGYGRGESWKPGFSCSIEQARFRHKGT